MKHEDVLSKLLTCDLRLMLRYDDDTRTPIIENNTLPSLCLPNSKTFLQEKAVEAKLVVEVDRQSVKAAYPRL
jgi:hypothetical protein